MSELPMSSILTPRSRKTGGEKFRYRQPYKKDFEKSDKSCEQLQTWIDMEV